MRQINSIRVVSFLIVQFAIYCFACFGYAPIHWQNIAKLRFDWNGRPNVQVFLDVPEAQSDARHFTRIRIQVPGEKQFVLNNDRGWARLHYRFHNPLRSDFVLAMDSTEGRTTLVLVGFSDALLPESLDMIELPSTGVPRVVLHSGNSGVWTLKDLDNDGIAELVAYTCPSEDVENGLPTHLPFDVYRLGSVPGDRPQVSIPLTNDYNKIHYREWSRAKCCKKKKRWSSVGIVLQ